MTTVQLEKHAGVFQLNGRTLGTGGEATVYEGPDLPQLPPLVVKAYHKPTPERADKLAAMIANPPADPMAGTGHVSIAWPLERVFTPSPLPVVAPSGVRATTGGCVFTPSQPSPGSGEGRVGVCLGYIMPRVDGTRSIFEFYNPRSRLQTCPLFHFGYLLRTARNLASAVQAIHDRGYVIGDVNESNILVTNTALVTLVDTDSFQVPVKAQIHRCPVGKPEYTPPELQGANFPDIDRRPEHDAFGLGVLIFQLLMQGIHPFLGRFTGQGEPPDLNRRISEGSWPYVKRRQAAIAPMPHAPPFELLPPEIQDLLLQCFEDGHDNPAVRPTAGQWMKALRQAEEELVPCMLNPQHLYYRNLDLCPWCVLAQRQGRDPFPNKDTVVPGSGSAGIRPSRPMAGSPRPGSRSALRTTVADQPRLTSGTGVTPVVPAEPQISPRWIWIGVGTICAAVLLAAMIVVFAVTTMSGPQGTTAGGTSDKDRAATSASGEVLNVPPRSIGEVGEPPGNRRVEPGGVPADRLFDHGPAVFLADVREFYVKEGRWPFKKDGTTGNGKDRILVNRKPSPKGLGMHPPAAPAYAAVKYRLDKQAAAFKTTVAVDDTATFCFTPGVFTVLGDGKELFQSKLIAHNHLRSQECTVDVSGVDVLELRVHCIGHNSGVHAVWFEPQLLQRADAPLATVPARRLGPAPRLFSQAPVAFLADLPEFDVEPGPWPFTKDGTIGNGKDRIRVNRKPSPKGLGMHPPGAPAHAAVKYRPGKQAALFRATVAVDDTATFCWTPAVFTVLGDGKELFQSKWIAHNHARSQECTVDVRGVDVLELRVHCVGHNSGVHAVWFEPRLLHRADTPDVLVADIVEPPPQPAKPAPAPAAKPVPPRRVADVPGALGPVMNVAFSPDRRRALIAGGMSQLAARLWDVEKNTEIRKFAGHTGWGVTCVAIHPDGRKGASGAGLSDGTIRLWDLETGQELRLFRHDNAVSDVNFSADGSKIISASTDRTARIWDVATGEELQRFKTFGFARSAALSADGRYAAASGMARTNVWDPKTGKQVVELGNRANRLIFLADNRLLSTVDKIVQLWDINTGKELRRFDDDAGISSLALSPDGKRFVAGNEKGTVRVWELETGAKIVDLEVGEKPVRGLAFSADGRSCHIAAEGQLMEQRKLP